MGAHKVQGVLAVLENPGDGHLAVVLYILFVDLGDHGIVLYDDNLIHTNPPQETEFIFNYTWKTSKRQDLRGKS